MIAALLIGREKSVGFPNKNFYIIKGKVMMAYPLLAALKSETVSKVFVSTDSPKIKEIARRYGTEIIDRPPELCTDKALGENVFVHGYNEIKRKHSDLELLVLLHCNSPTVSPALIDKGVQVLQDNPTYDSAVSVSKYNMWSPLRARKIGADGLLHPFVPFETFGDPKTLNCDRDSQGDVWFADMAVSVVRPRCLKAIHEGLLPQKWMGRKIYPLKQVAGLDIDYEWQVGQAEYWIEHNGVL